MIIYNCSVNMDASHDLILCMGMIHAVIKCKNIAGHGMVPLYTPT